jgi:hypothetical protein
MAEGLFFDELRDSILVSDPDANDCCYEGRAAQQDLYRATFVQGLPGFEHITDESIHYLERRCAAVDGCYYSWTGVCALKAADIKDIP